MIDTYPAWSTRCTSSTYTIVVATRTQLRIPGKMRQVSIRTVFSMVDAIFNLSGRMVQCERLTRLVMT